MLSATVLAQVYNWNTSYYMYIYYTSRGCMGFGFKEYERNKYK